MEDRVKSLPPFLPLSLPPFLLPSIVPHAKKCSTNSTAPPQSKNEHQTDLDRKETNAIVPSREPGTEARPRENLLQDSSGRPSASRRSGAPIIDYVLSTDDGEEKRFKRAAGNLWVWDGQGWRRLGHMGDGGCAGVRAWHWSICRFQFCWFGVGWLGDVMRQLLAELCSWIDTWRCYRTT